jgi:hypothetical protein
MCGEKKAVALGCSLPAAIIYSILNQNEKNEKKRIVLPPAASEFLIPHSSFLIISPLRSLYLNQN